MYTIRNGQPALALAALQHRSLQVCPDMDPVAAGFFHNPAFQHGQNIFCAVDENNTSLIYGYYFEDGRQSIDYLKASGAAQAGASGHPALAHTNAGRAGPLRGRP